MRTQATDSCTICGAPDAQYGAFDNDQDWHCWDHIDAMNSAVGEARFGEYPDIAPRCLTCRSGKQCEVCIEAATFPDLPAAGEQLMIAPSTDGFFVMGSYGEYRNFHVGRSFAWDRWPEFLEYVAGMRPVATEAAE